MSAPSNDEPIDAYLWDPAAPPVDEVRAVETALAPLRFDPQLRQLAVTAPAWKPRRSWRWVSGLAAAAATVLIACTLFMWWRSRWPDGQPWVISAGPVAAPERLAVGPPLLLSGSDEARILVARIGTLSVKGDARLTLQSTGGSRHRLVLDRGTVHVRVWAPPGSINIQTPAGEVIDLGCEFDLSVDAAGSSGVSVRSGWVLIANPLGETLVPAGAASEMRSDRRPGAPVFTDATPAFTAAVRAFEADAGGGLAHVDAIVASARARDVLTLLDLVQRRAGGSDRFAARAAELAPPPAGVSLAGVVRGEAGAMDRWRDSLPLPPPKGWLRNWRDALPAWLVPGAR
jgi:hypothetical protein